jgi:hypothetical protein
MELELECKLSTLTLGTLSNSYTYADNYGDDSISFDYYSNNYN